METRTGTGFDVHPFEPGDAVWLGGVRIPHTAKLKGHSDADAALHALTDAIYGALGEGDIGTHLPAVRPAVEGRGLGDLPRACRWLVAERGGRIVNLDLTIVCEAPRIAPHVAGDEGGASATSAALPPSRVAIKATTSEQLGFTGRGEGHRGDGHAPRVELPRED